MQAAGADETQAFMPVSKSVCPLLKK